MFRCLIAIPALLMLIACVPISSSGQGYYNDNSEFYPTYILVHLFAEQNRMTELKKHNLQKETDILKKDVANVMQATINDFERNFSFCPVYYYIDTNLDAILDGQFEGILLDKNLSQVTQLPSAAEKTYAIVYYGTALWQSNKRKLRPNAMKYESGKPNGSGLVVMNSDFEQISYVHWSGIDLFEKKGRLVNKTEYFSKKFDIHYYPLAGRLSNKLKNNSIELKDWLNRPANKQTNAEN